MISRRNLLAGAAAGLGATMLAPLEAMAATWVNLGSKDVNLLVDHDTIRVGAGAGLYTDIRIKVSGNAVFIHDLHITFSSGAGYDVPIRFLFLPGTASRVINLAGPARRIRKVDLVYSKVIGGGRATVTLQGRKL